MARVIVSEHAKRDLRRILSDLNGRAGYRVAERYARDFKATYRRLADVPGSGPPRLRLERSLESRSFRPTWSSMTTRITP
jgi:plasmid stabilization system protein ParE